MAESNVAGSRNLPLATEHPPPSPQDILPPRRAWTRTRAARAAVWWSITTGAVFLLAQFDLNLMSRIGVDLNAEPHPLVQAAQALSEWPVLIFVVPVALADRRRKLVICHVLFSAYIGFNLVHLGKKTIVRERPYATFDRLAADPDLPRNASWLGVGLDFRKKQTLESFPSGHTANAFALAATLAWFYPSWRMAFLLLATACAVSRVIQGAHWPSDCLAGAAIGIASTWISLQFRTLTTPSRWFRRAPH